MPANDFVTQVQVSIPYFTAIPEDVVVNVLHFVYTQPEGAVEANYLELGNKIKAFYDEVYATTAMATWMVKTGAKLKFYDLTQPTPRQPVYLHDMVITATQVAGNTPTEVAICASFAATPRPDTPVARQRGRIFLGGFASACEAGGVNFFPRITAGVRDGICTAMENLRADALTADWLWVIYSPTGNRLGEQETFDVSHGWVDDTPDTQRRRGVTTLVRSTWP